MVFYIIRGIIFLSPEVQIN